MLKHNFKHELPFLYEVFCRNKTLYDGTCSLESGNGSSNLVYNNLIQGGEIKNE